MLAVVVLCGAALAAEIAKQGVEISESVALAAWQQEVVADICGDNVAACRDCSGVVLGTATVDACGVCQGDGSSCTRPECELTPSEKPLKALKRGFNHLLENLDQASGKLAKVVAKCASIEKRSSHDDDDDDEDDEDNHHKKHRKHHSDGNVGETWSLSSRHRHPKRHHAPKKDITAKSETWSYSDSHRHAEIVEKHKRELDAEQANVVAAVEDADKRDVAAIDEVEGHHSHKSHHDSHKSHHDSHKSHHDDHDDHLGSIPGLVLGDENGSDGNLGETWSLSLGHRHPNRHHAPKKDLTAKSETWSYTNGHRHATIVHDDDKREVDGGDVAESVEGKPNAYACTARRVRFENEVHELRPLVETAWAALKFKEANQCK